MNKDGPWLPPKFTRESAAASGASLSNITSATKLWIDTGQIPTDLSLVELCHLSTECLPWLNAETITALCQMMHGSEDRSTLSTLSTFRIFVRRVLCALAKHAQPCHGDYVGLATELQLIGLAHGDDALRQRAQAYAATLRGSGDVVGAADVLWTFLTAKAIEMPIFEALEHLDVSSASGDAVAAILCGLAQPQVTQALGELGALVRIAEPFASSLTEGPGSEALKFVPAQTFPRLALALSDLLKNRSMPKTSKISKALQVVLQIGLQNYKTIFTLEELSDLVVACSASLVDGPFVGELIAELARRTDGATHEPRLVPGAAVALRKPMGSIPANSQGLLGEFYLARGQWRVWLDVGCVNVREEDLELLDQGLRPKRCCHKCWKLSRQLSDSSCLAKLGACDTAQINLSRC